MSTIFLVLACVDYEGSSPVKAFRKKHAAEAFAHRCKEPRFLELPPRVVIDAPENDREWELFFAAKREWEASHPAGAIHCHADNFVVSELELL